MKSVTGRIRVALVDDNDVFREALEILLNSRGDLEIVGSAAGGEEAIEQCDDWRADVILLDYRLPGIDGVQATAALHQRCPHSAIVCLTASATLREMEAVQAAGAVACLSKDAQLDDIVAGIREAATSAVRR